MSWSSWDVDPKVVWTISIQRMHLSSRTGSRGEAKCYWRDGRQCAWNFHSQSQEICVESQSTVEDTGVTSCISVQYSWKCGFAKYSDNLYTPCILTENTVLWINLFYYWLNKKSKNISFLYELSHLCKRNWWQSAPETHKKWPVFKKAHSSTMEDASTIQ
jgi:hypothetical protein